MGKPKENSQMLREPIGNVQFKLNGPMLSQQTTIISRHELTTCQQDWPWDYSGEGWIN